MYNNFVIIIPQELKKEFLKQKQIIIENHFPNTAEDIEYYLNKNDIFGVYDSIIPILNSQVSFFSNYHKWLNFILLELLKAIGININNPNYIKDIYNIMRTVRIISASQKTSKENNKDYLIKLTKKYISTCDKNYITNPKAEEIFELFISIELGLINPNDLIDTSYKHYQKKKKKINTIIKK